MEKREADAKKEIQKPQSNREQIESNEIKDEKISERQLDKEGLGRQLKTDPKDNAKVETRDWLNNAKEKCEADLKKEIQKLQRYGDQIESSEIKDKKVSPSNERAMVDVWKLIKCEVDKEGLGQQPKTDPKDNAKAKTRDWLKIMVGELELKIDNFEAEIEELSVNKGKTRPPRLTHLKTSITWHNVHIMKLELILRLLDNDELSTEQVNHMKDFLDDYLKHNQEDFEECNDVDELYNKLPLAVKSLDHMVTIGSPGLVKATFTPTHQQGTSAAEQIEDAASQECNSDILARTTSSMASTPAVGQANPISVTVPAENLSSVANDSSALSGSSSVQDHEVDLLFLCMFGNVDIEGNLTADYLEEEASNKITATDRNLFPPLAKVEAFVNSSTEEDSEDNEDYDGDSIEGSEIEAAVEQGKYPSGRDDL